MARNLGLEAGVDVAEQIRVEAAPLFRHRDYGMTAIREMPPPLRRPYLVAIAPNGLLLLKVARGADG